MKYPARHSAKKLIATKTAQQERSLSVLRLRHGSSSLRRTIRHGLRCDSHLERRSFVIASPDNTQSHDVGSITAKTQAMRLPDHKPGLLRLPLELRQQIYGYLIPFNDQHILQSRGRERYVPNLAGRCPISSDQNPIQVSLCYPREYEPGRAWTAILRLNQRLHCETRYVLLNMILVRVTIIILLPFCHSPALSTILSLRSTLVNTSSATARSRFESMQRDIRSLRLNLEGHS